ncbi:hypothetical protein L2E82_47218 [Cichorium intybus]|uniref:Uncharacterized protein n=1 Tax=Cichorium intybus TaxID=13427 RepID=A0ACB8YW35_CICIN|nr:hypothetical protein L2E82_47218 [Cichorium intybus]
MQKHRSFGFVTFLEREDAAAAMDNMDDAELYGRALTVNYTLPEKIKGGEQGWAAQPSVLLKNCIEKKPADEREGEKDEQDDPMAMVGERECLVNSQRYDEDGAVENGVD